MRWRLPRLQQGEVLKLIAEVREIANQLPEGESWNKVENVAVYFEKRASATHYDVFKERGWPIASGNVEGGHRTFMHPITKRGAGWRAEHLNGLAALACLRQSPWWDEFWSFVNDGRRERDSIQKPLKYAA